MDLKLIKNQFLHLRQTVVGEPASFYAFAWALAERLPDNGEPEAFASIAETLHKECLAGKAPVSMKYVYRHHFTLHLKRIYYTLRELGYTEFADQIGDSFL